MLDLALSVSVSISLSLSLHIGCVDDALSCRERAHTGPDAGASRNYVTSHQADWL